MFRFDEKKEKRLVLEGILFVLVFTEFTADTSFGLFFPVGVAHLLNELQGGSIKSTVRELFFHTLIFLSGGRIVSFLGKQELPVIVMA